MISPSPRTDSFTSGIWLIFLFLFSFHSKLYAQFSQADSSLADFYYDRGFQVFFSDLDSSFWYNREAASLYTELGIDGKAILATNVMHAISQRQSNMLQAKYLIDSLYEVVGDKLGRFDAYKASDKKEVALSYAVSMNNYAKFYEEFGLYSEALQAYQKNMTFALAQDLDPMQVSIYYSCLGDIYSTFKDFETAKGYYKLALDLRQRESQIALQVSKAHLSISNTFLGTQEVDSARYYFRLSKNIYDSMEAFWKSDFDVSQIYEVGISIDLTDGNLAQAEAKLRQFKGIVDKNPEMVYRLTEYWEFMADLEKQRKNYALSNQFLDTAKLKTLQLFPEKNGFRLSNLLYRQAQNHLKLQDYNQANVYLDSALAYYSAPESGILEEDPSMLELVRDIYRKKASINLRNSSVEDLQIAALEEAHTYYEEALKVLTANVNSIRSDQKKAELLEDAYGLFEKDLELLTQMWSETGDEKWVEAAFRKMEESKSVLLRINLAQSTAQKEAKLSDELVQKEDSFKKEIVRLQLNIAASKRKGEAITELTSELTQLQTKFELWIKKLENTFPYYYQQKVKADIYPFDELVQLGKQEDLSIVHVFWGNTYVFIWKQTKDGFSLEQFPTTIFSFALEPLLNALGERNKSQVGLAAFQDASLNLSLLLDLPVGGKFLFIPDGPLQRLPLDVLVAQKSPKEQWKNIDYLFHSTKILYGYSATLFFKEWEKNNAGSLEWLGFAPAYPQQLGLFANTEEVKRIYQLMGGQIRQDSQATKAVFTKMSPAARMIHVAGHGIPDTSDYILSHLLFSYSHQDDQAKLNIPEIYNLGLASPLVVLSACQSGYGKISQGEGVRSLGRAFRYGGASAVLTTLWQVDDKASSLFMGYFYEALKEEKLASTAIQLARKRFIQEAPARYQHPFYWGAFVLEGEFEYNNPFPNWIWMMGGIVATFLLVMLLLRRRNQRSS
ncbi:MAG: CHAT domain-containing tetratricopeptide repeat protein [Bacteroidota bacterium]